MIRKLASVLLLSAAVTFAGTAAAEVTGSLGTASPAASAPRAAVPVLRSEVTVGGDLVRIGDLFENAGALADVPVFRSPDPGETGSVPTAQVVAAVRGHNMFLFDTRDLAAVSVSRAGRIIAAKEIVARLADALSAQAGLGPAEAIAVTPDSELRSVHVESSATGTIGVARLNYDPRTRRFYAVLDLPGGREPPLRVSGTAVETVDVAVLRRSLGRGDLVQPADVAIERRARAEAGPDALTSVGQADGLSAQRSLRAGQVLRNADLIRPDIVQRNDMVTVIYRAPGIVISARGKALESGSEGAEISVLNEQSKRTIHGRVVGPGQVLVVAQGPRLAANIPPAAPARPVQTARNP